MKVMIYIEGHSDLRKGFKIFFDSYFKKETSIKVFMCKGRPIKEFCRAMPQNNTDFKVLLMDADILTPPDYIQSVKDRSEFKACPEKDIADEQLHFMVQCMESWFIADKAKLVDYYGQGFRMNRLPRRSNVEEIPKEDVDNSIKGAVVDTNKRIYQKVRHATEILQIIEPQKVCERAPHCKRLFETLEIKLKG